MIDKLKPCPFCGSTDDLELYQETPTAYFLVVCWKCNDMARKTKRGAITAWNTRAKDGEK